MSQSCMDEMSISTALALIAGVLGLVGIFRSRYNAERAVNLGLVTVLFIATVNFMDAMYRTVFQLNCRPAGYPSPVFEIVGAAFIIVVTCCVGVIRERHRRRHHIPVIKGLQGEIRAVRSDNVIALTVMNGNTGLHIILNPDAAARWNAAIDSIYDGAEAAEFSRGKACVTFTASDEGLIIEAYNADAPHLRTMVELTDDKISEIQDLVKTIIRPLAA